MRIALFDPVTGAAPGSTFTYDTAANQYNLGWDTASASKGCWDIIRHVIQRGPEGC